MMIISMIEYLLLTSNSYLVDFWKKYEEYIQLDD